MTLHRAVGCQLSLVHLIRRPLHDGAVHAVLNSQHSDHRVAVRADQSFHETDGQAFGCSPAQHQERNRVFVIQLLTCLTLKPPGLFSPPLQMECFEMSVESKGGEKKVLLLRFDGRWELLVVSSQDTLGHSEQSDPAAALQRLSTLIHHRPVKMLRWQELQRPIIRSTCRRREAPWNCVSSSHQWVNCPPLH